MKNKPTRTKPHSPSLRAKANGKRKGELDLIDIISSMLWDECEGDDLKALDSISEKTIDKWESDMRTDFNRNKANVFFTSDGSVRRQ